MNWQPFMNNVWEAGDKRSLHRGEQCNKIQKYKIHKIMMKGEKCENDNTSLNTRYKTTYKEGKEVNLCR